MFIYPHSSIAKFLHLFKAVRNEQNGNPVFFWSSLSYPCTFLKVHISNCKHFIYQEYVRWKMGNYWKSKPRNHPWRIGSYRLLYELSKLRKLYYFNPFSLKFLSSSYAQCFIALLLTPTSFGSYNKRICGSLLLTQICFIGQTSHIPVKC